MIPHMQSLVKLLIRVERIHVGESIEEQQRRGLMVQPLMPVMD